MQRTLLDSKGNPLPKSWGQFASSRNKYLWRGLKVPVEASTKVVYFPRKKHYAPSVLTVEDGDDVELYLENHHETLEPCIERRDPMGWNRWHECSYHKVYLEQVSST